MSGLETRSGSSAWASMPMSRVLCCQTTSDLNAGARSPFQTAQNRLRQKVDRVVLAGNEPISQLVLGEYRVSLGRGRGFGSYAG